MIKLLVSLAALAGFVWFGANVPLGSRTLFGHLQAIGQTREAKDLVEGTKESARPLVEEAGRRLARKAADSDKETAPAERSSSRRGERDEQGDRGERGEQADRADRREQAEPTASGAPSSGARPTAAPETKPQPPSERVSDDDKQALRRVAGNAAARKPPRTLR